MADEYSVIDENTGLYLMDSTKKWNLWTDNWESMKVWEASEPMEIVVAGMGSKENLVVGPGGSSNPVGGVRPPKP